MMARIFAAAVGVALLIAAAIMVLWLVMGAAAAFSVFYGGRWLWRKHRARVDARAHDRAELLARADIQHQWVLAGDPRGIYGRYTPTRVATRRTA